MAASCSVGGRILQDDRARHPLRPARRSAPREGCCRTRGGRLRVRGRCGLTSTRSTRSGSVPARISSSRVAPRCSDRLTRPLGVGRCGLGGHDARGESGEDRGELAEPAGDELDVVALGQQDALGGPEEPGAVRHARLGQDGVVPEQECARRAPDPPSRRARPERSGMHRDCRARDQNRSCHAVGRGRRPPRVCTSWSRCEILPGPALPAHHLGGPARRCRARTRPDSAPGPLGPRSTATMSRTAAMHRSRRGRLA